MSAYDPFYALFGSFWFWYGLLCLALAAGLTAFGAFVAHVASRVRLRVQGSD